jgi:spore coat polysaccharide biosynthesis predicted glycosyltransferase SpsG
VVLVPPAPELGSFVDRHGIDSLAVTPTADEIVATCDAWAPSCLIMDSYRFAARELSAMRRSSPLFVYFDDEATQDVPADVVVNGSPAADSLPYRRGPDKTLLLGAEYQVLRPQFSGGCDRDYSRAPKSVLLTVGGDDLTGQFDSIIERLANEWLPRRPGVTVDCVVGPLFKRSGCTDLGEAVRTHRDPADLRALMERADLAVSAGGQTLFELARCGVPAVAFCAESDQLPNLLALEQAGAIKYIGWADQRTWLRRLSLGLDSLFDDAGRRRAVGVAASELIDGQGAFRIAEVLSERIGA